MNLELIMSSIAVLLGVLAAVYARTAFKKSRDYCGLLEFLAQRIEDLEQTVTAVKDLNETGAQRISEQARRVAWLETRVRQPKLIEEDVLNDAQIEISTKSIITERRHRVLTLAARGQSVEEIAETLGMMHGEIQLIINLSRITA
ncbi:MAG: hypothetical protein LH614_07825 [Pyrinomonadaceae bacterium]|nr:hypothetical protein [Pyrinomonadaceae bacterium]